jgi:hypothetical protein
MDSEAHSYDVPPALWRRLWWHRHWAVFAAAFLTPFALLGLIGWVVQQYDDESPAANPSTLFPSPDPEVTGAWPPNVMFIAHTTPAMIRDELPVPGVQCGYQFAGRAGETWLITVEPQDTLDPHIYLYEPSGGELAYNDDRGAGDLTAEILVILPADGAYRLLVESAPKSAGSTGTYLLTLFEQ